MEMGELARHPQGFFPGQPRTLGIGDEVEVLPEMPTEIEGETKDDGFRLFLWLRLYVLGKDPYKAKCF